MSVWIDLWIAILDFISVLQTVKCFHSNLAMLVQGFARIPIQIIRSIFNLQCKFCTISMQLKVWIQTENCSFWNENLVKSKLKELQIKNPWRPLIPKTALHNNETLENESKFKMFFGFAMCNSCSIMELCKHNMCRQQEQINV